PLFVLSPRPARDPRPGSGGRALVAGLHGAPGAKRTVALQDLTAARVWAEVERAEASVMSAVIQHIRKPIRIQRQRTKGWRMPANTVYVGRPTKWGNPFIASTDPDARYGRGISAEIAVNCFRRCLDKEGLWSSIPVHQWPQGKIPAEWVT